MTIFPKLIVAISNYAAFLLHVNQTATGQYKFSGIYGKYVELILIAWKGEYEILFCNDFDLGAKDPSGNWTGQIGAVSRGEADIGISHISISEKRMEVVDFSTAYSMEALTFAAQKWSEDDIFQFLLLFDKAVWVSLFVSLISLSVFFFLILEGKENYSYILLNAFANIIGKSLDLHKDLFRWKLLLGCWLLCAFVVSCSYSAVLLSFLTLPPQSKIVKDFRDLSEAIQKSNHRAYSAKFTLTVPFMVNSEADYLQKIGNAIMKNEWYIDFDSLLKEHDPKTVLIMTRSVLNFLFGTGDLKSLYHISSDDLFVVPVGIPMNKNFCCGSRINNIVSRIASAGLHEKVLNDVSFRYWLDIFSKFMTKKDQNSRPLSVIDLRGSFAILCICLGFSLIVLFGEIIFERIQRIKKETIHNQKPVQYKFENPHKITWLKIVWISFQKRR
ncbi:Glutamate receptor ionotropic like protein [Argiope bruennichi]|uniref:Glutamate receptor ionotropic like protein n=1 Tax=Argiope bruennichi TaxID=94029 RepID=A0A8T0E0K0_ARGBR|nr:Glutamate receptor ionotropic like protein [Argiope bruennichi]